MVMDVSNLLAAYSYIVSEECKDLLQSKRRTFFAPLDHPHFRRLTPHLAAVGAVLNVLS